MSVPLDDDLEAGIARLKAIEAIKSLEAQHWYCCDHKDVEGEIARLLRQS